MRLLGHRLVPARAFAACTTGTALIAASPSLYLLALTAVAVRYKAPANGDAVTADQRMRFAVCIPAHDEQSSIASTVEALLEQEYPVSKFSVHVVADNCSDSTAEAAVRSGAHVHVRSDLDHPGKGEALNWLLRRLPTDFDAIAFVDADTIADKDFLAALDRAFRGGARAAQGFYTVKDPDTSAAVALRFAAIACRHHLRPLARTKLGLSAGLYGNGMAFRTDVLEGRRWSNHLIEDAEFQLELLLDGETVTYVPDAIVRAEMPDTLAAATSQNERWELGRLQLVGRYVPLLVRRAVTGGALPRRTYADAVADHMTPPLTLLALVDGVAVALGALAVATRPVGRSRAAAATAVVSSLVLGLHVLVALRLVGAPPAVYRSLLSAPRALTWKLRLLTHITRSPTDVTWVRTERNQPTGAVS